MAKPTNAFERNRGALNAALRSGNVGAVQKLPDHIGNQESLGQQMDQQPGLAGWSDSPFSSPIDAFGRVGGQVYDGDRHEFGRPPVAGHRAQARWRAPPAPAGAPDLGPGYAFGFGEVEPFDADLAAEVHDQQFPVQHAWTNQAGVQFGRSGQQPWAPALPVANPKMGVVDEIEPTLSALAGEPVRLQRRVQVHAQEQAARVKAAAMMSQQAGLDGMFDLNFVPDGRGGMVGLDMLKPGSRERTEAIRRSPVRAEWLKMKAEGLDVPGLRLPAPKIAKAELARREKLQQAEADRREERLAPAREAVKARGLARGAAKELERGYGPGMLWQQAMGLDPLDRFGLLGGFGGLNGEFVGRRVEARERRAERALDRQAEVEQARITAAPRLLAEMVRAGIRREEAKRIVDEFLGAVGE